MGRSTGTWDTTGGTAAAGLRGWPNRRGSRWKAGYVNSIGLAGWWVNAHLWKREAQSDAQIAVFDRFVAPLLERVEAVMPPPFGQSLLAVLRK